VLLPELIQQSAALIAPALRARISIELDRSLAGLGTIRVARTTLQQVFQNLILNAAEAVGDSERERGTLRVSATLVPGASGEQLRCCFADDGIGIQHGDLRHLFDKSFSTKAPAANSGIGLHWCANALRALGGSMQVESHGPNLGASFFVTLPLQRSAPG